MIALLLLLIPPPSPIVDHVDLYEINHVHGADGQVRLTQAIFWDWSLDYGFVVRDYRIIDGNCENLSLGQWPVFVSGIRGPRELAWYDKRDRVFRKVICEQAIETWTRYDPELRSRKVLPTIGRRKLSAPGVPAGRRVESVLVEGTMR